MTRHLARPYNLAVGGNTACGRTVPVAQIYTMGNQVPVNCQACIMYAQMMEVRHPSMAKLWRGTYRKD